MDSLSECIAIGNTTHIVLPEQAAAYETAYYNYDIIFHSYIFLS
jgi:hypothetical protein